MNGDQLPSLLCPPPGPQSRALVDRLAQVECPAITARRARRAAQLGLADDDPVVWAEARGANVQDADGNIFVDLSAGFGVAAAGHAHPEVVAAVQRQAQTLLHAMGDAFPDPRRIELMERLCALVGMGRVILGSSGSDAVEAAVKTACMATGRHQILCFTGGYHGLALGALAHSLYGEGYFRAPFAPMLGQHVRRAPFGGELPSLSDCAAVLVEPIQGRGGVRLPPAGWLAQLIQQAHAQGCLVIFDEIYTGMGRTGAWTRAAALGLEPDLICLGKGLASGMPISACLGRREVMDAWGASRGASLHTQTFLGHPVGAAAALASLSVVEHLMPEVEERGQLLRRRCAEMGVAVRGAGLLLGLELPSPLWASRELLRRGFLALPAGQPAEPGEGVPGGEVLCLTPPLCITEAQLHAFADALEALLLGQGQG